MKKKRKENKQIIIKPVVSLNKEHLKLRSYEEEMYIRNSFYTDKGSAIYEYNIDTKQFIFTDKTNNNEKTVIDEIVPGFFRLIIFYNHYSLKGAILLPNVWCPLCYCTRLNILYAHRFYDIYRKKERKDFLESIKDLDSNKYTIKESTSKQVGYCQDTETKKIISWYMTRYSTRDEVEKEILKFDDKGKSTLFLNSMPIYGEEYIHDSEIAI